MPPNQSDPLTPVEPFISKGILEELTGSQVLNYRIENGCNPGDGFQSVIYSVTAELIPISDDDEGLHPAPQIQHFLFKCFPRHPSRQRQLRKTNIFYKELSFYRLWAQALRDFQREVVGLSDNELITPAFPPFLGGSAIDFTEDDEIQGCIKPMDNFIVMKDLKKTEGFQMVSRASGLDKDHLSLALTELAKMHALSWTYKNKVEWDVTKNFPFLKTAFDENDKDIWINILRKSAETAAKAINERMGKDGDRLSEAITDFKEKVPQVIDYFLQQREHTPEEAWDMHRSPSKELVVASKSENTWRIPIHGDTWINNMLYRYDKATGKPDSVILLDFALAREACPTVDLAYLIYTSTTAAFRKLHLDALLQLYCMKFVEFCGHLKVRPLPGFGVTSLKRRFHRAKIIGFMMAVGAFPHLYREKQGKDTDMEKAGEDKKLGEMLTEALGKGALESRLYKERIVELAEDLYDDGVI